MKRVALYVRVSTLDQHPETQQLELHSLAQQRGLQVIKEYVDHGFSGARTKRPALDELLADARRRRFDLVMVWACDRLARSTKHFLEVLDEFRHLGIEFVSLRENIDTHGPLGRAVVTIIGAIAELERSLIVERVRAGMRRAKLEGRHVGRKPLDIDRQAILRDRSRGLSLGELAKLHRLSRTSVARILKDAVPKGVIPAPLQLNENRQPKTAA